MTLAAGAISCIAATDSPAYITIASTAPVLPASGGWPEPFGTGTVFPAIVTSPTTSFSNAWTAEMQRRKNLGRGLVATSGQVANAPLTAVEPAVASTTACL